MENNKKSEILITGGTGLLGKAVCKLFEQHEIPYTVATHRQQDTNEDLVFIDMVTGEGIAEAIAGKKIILHLASDKKQPDNDVTGTRALLKELEYKDDKPHLIYISIVGVHLLPLPYFKQKWQVEQDIANAKVSYSILRATQFHEYIDQTLQQFLKWPVGILPKKVLIQPVDVQTVAEVLFLMVNEKPSGKTENLGGSQKLSLADAAESWIKHNNRKIAVLNFPLWGAIGKNLNSGALTCNEAAKTSISWNTWLSGRSHTLCN